MLPERRETKKTKSITSNKTWNWLKKLTRRLKRELQNRVNSKKLFVRKNWLLHRDICPIISKICKSRLQLSTRKHFRRLSWTRNQLVPEESPRQNDRKLFRSWIRKRRSWVIKLKIWASLCIQIEHRINSMVLCSVWMRLTKESRYSLEIGYTWLISDWLMSQYSIRFTGVSTCNYDTTN